jgi:hypothetical protein
MSDGSDSGLWEVYLDSIREHGHQLLAWAHADVRSKIDADTDEPSITGLLCDAMKKRINSPTTPDVYTYYAVGDQDPVSPAGERGNDRLRLDISILRTGIRPQLAYVFEAKRLRTGGFPIGKYTGDGGMGDFLACRYAQGCPEGTMVGLWQDKDAAYWIRELKRAFDNDIASKEPRLGILENLKATIVIEPIRDHYRSIHQRSDRSRMILLHAFLPCGSA